MVEPIQKLHSAIEVYRVGLEVSILNFLITFIPLTFLGTFVHISLIAIHSDMGSLISENEKILLDAIPWYYGNEQDILVDK